MCKASLCGHFEVVQLLLDSGALCERDTFQGERCLYNALNDRIRNLLLSYDYSKSTDPLQPLAAHLSSLLHREHPKTADITLVTGSTSFHVHKFVLAARSPYFAKKLAAAPEVTNWKIPDSLPSQSLEVAIRFLYLAEVAADLGDDEEEQAVLAGIEKLSRYLEINRLFDRILQGEDRRLARQLRTEEIVQGQRQLEQWFQDNILGHKIIIDTDRAKDIRWDRGNAIFADVLLRADEDPEDDQAIPGSSEQPKNYGRDLSAIPIGPSSQSSRSLSPCRQKRKSTLFPAHRAMLLRSEFFATMFSSSFREAHEKPHLQIIPIDCSPVVLELVLHFMYTENTMIPLEYAIDVVYAADLLFIEKLKVKAAMIISTLGNGAASIVEAENPRGVTGPEGVINIYDVVRAGWATRVHRLEEFGARYIAYRLERYIDELDFAELVRESASRIKDRQNTDSIELIDDIRYYLSDRFRLRFEDAGLDEMMDEGAVDDSAPSATSLLKIPEDEGVNMWTLSLTPTTEPGDQHHASDMSGAMRTLDGELAGDEFAQDAINYQILLGKIDTLLDRLKLEA